DADDPIAAGRDLVVDLARAAEAARVRRQAPPLAEQVRGPEALARHPAELCVEDAALLLDEAGLARVAPRERDRERALQETREHQRAGRGRRELLREARCPLSGCARRRGGGRHGAGAARSEPPCSARRARASSGASPRSCMSAASFTAPPARSSAR